MTMTVVSTGQSPNPLRVWESLLKLQALSKKTTWKKRLFRLTVTIQKDKIDYWPSKSSIEQFFCFRRLLLLALGQALFDPSQLSRWFLPSFLQATASWRASGEVKMLKLSQLPDVKLETTGEKRLAKDLRLGWNVSFGQKVGGQNMIPWFYYFLHLWVLFEWYFLKMISFEHPLFCTVETPVKIWELSVQESSLSNASQMSFATCWSTRFCTIRHKSAYWQTSLKNWLTLFIDWHIKSYKSYINNNQQKASCGFVLLVSFGCRPTAFHNGHRTACFLAGCGDASDSMIFWWSFGGSESKEQLRPGLERNRFEAGLFSNAAGESGVKNSKSFSVGEGDEVDVLTQL